MSDLFEECPANKHEFYNEDDGPICIDCGYQPLEETDGARWKEEARQYAQNADYWKGRAEKAESELTRLSDGAVK